METAQKWEQAERPFLRLENTKKALFCPLLYFKVPKRTKKPHPEGEGRTIVEDLELRV